MPLYFESSITTTSLPQRLKNYELDRVFTLTASNIHYKMCRIIMHRHLCGWQDPRELTREPCNFAIQSSNLVHSFSGNWATASYDPQRRAPANHVHQLRNLADQCSDMTEEEDIVYPSSRCAACDRECARLLELGEQAVVARVRYMQETGRRWAGYGR